MKTSKTEVSVEDAAQILQVTTRTVINYLRAKEIAAVKVGKSWFINHASLVAFAQQHGLGPRPTPPDSTVTAPKRPGDWSKITGLKLFIRAKTLLSQLQWHHLTPQYPEMGAELLQRQILAIIALIGSGFYSYRQQHKIQLYQQGKEKLGAIVAWYYFFSPPESPTPPQIQAIEEDLLPMFGALIGHLEKARNQKTGHHP